MNATLKIQVTKSPMHACRNRITHGGVSLWKTYTNEICSDEIGGGFYSTKYFIRCTQHENESEKFYYRSHALALIHRPWLFCEKCKRIHDGSVRT